MDLIKSLYIFYERGLVAPEKLPTDVALSQSSFDLPAESDGICRRKRMSRRDGAGQAVVHVECGAIWLLAMRFLNSLRGYILT